MNESPADALLVPAQRLTTLVDQIGVRAGLSVAHAALLAELLVANESRGGSTPTAPSRSPRTPACCRTGR